MRNVYKIGFAALSALLCISCDRTAQSVQKASEVSRQAVPDQPVTSVEEPVDSDPLEPPMPSDSLVVSDTAGVDFTPEDLVAVKSTLEAQLHLDEFTAGGQATPYGKPCRFYDTTSVRQYAGNDARVAFTRPRLIKITFVSDDHYVRLVSGSAEIVRLALAQRGVDGKWYGVSRVTRDTVSLLVRSSVDDTTWRVCENPAHTNGWDANASQKPVSAWLPIHATDAERMAVAWDDKFSAPKLRQLADSISKLPITYVVEGNPEPPMPKIYKDVCPGEGCSFGEWMTCDTLSAFTSAGDNPKAAFLLHRGDRFTAVTGDVHIKQAGKVVFTRNVKVEDEGTKFFFTPADTLYPLLYEGEGFGSWYFRGKESGGFFFFGNANQEATDIPVVAGVSGYVVVRPIISEWWVKVRAKNGREGWLRPHGSLYGMSPHYEDPMPKSCPGEKTT
jgi:hypothetical protein